ncbi:MAG: hypothetical protein JXK07_10095 [Spirochaetes bacterium]|nr:hypothetical protein [Spirochaetota bacterium]MBN2771251.1 hypothetical protein [Spirochaetota bacterium]
MNSTYQVSQAHQYGIAEWAFSITRCEYIASTKRGTLDTLDTLENKKEITRRKNND